MNPIVYVFGSLAFAGLILEDAVADWTGVLLVDDLGSTQAVAALTYPAYQGGMIAGRLFADRLRQALSDRVVVIGVGVAAGLGTLAIAAFAQPALVIAAIFIAGIGISPLEPLAVSLTGEAEPDRADAMIAQVGVIGYVGMLLGPMIVGGLASLIDLRTTFAVLAVILGSVVVAAGQLVPGRTAITTGAKATAEPRAEAGSGTARLEGRA